MTFSERRSTEVRARWERDPVVGPSDNLDRYVVRRAFMFYRHCIPAGYEFDGASVPRVFWRVVAPGRPWVLRAACGHDFLYDHAIKTKEYADNLFLRALREDMESVPKDKRMPQWLLKMMYRSVRVGGKGKYQ